MHVAAAEAEGGAEPCLAPGGPPLELELPSTAPVGAALLAEAPSVWSFDDERGLRVQEPSAVFSDGAHLPPAGAPLQGEPGAVVSRTPRGRARGASTRVALAACAVGGLE